MRQRAGGLSLQVIDALMKQGMSSETLWTWLKQLELLNLEPHSQYRVEWNIKLFMKALYFALEEQSDFTHVQTWIKKQILRVSYTMPQRSINWI